MVNLHTIKRTGWCALLCAACIIFALIGNAAPVHAAETGHVYGTIEQTEAGREVTVFFAISGNPGIWGMKGTISYDTSALTLISASAGNVFTASELMLPENVGQYPYTFLATGSAISNKTANGSIIILTFKVSEDAALNDYAVGIHLSQVINVDDEDVTLTTDSAYITVVSCIHYNTYYKNAVAATETEEGYTGDVHCYKCDVLLSKGSVIPKVVNTCEHKNTTTKVLQEATCTEDGKAERTCDDCGKLLEEKVIEKTGHEKTVIEDQKAPTTTEEGFTGNVRCKKCNALLEEGTTIPKIPILVFNMTTQTEDTYYRASGAGLVFVSDAELATFVRVEVNGNVLEESSYTLEEGSTKVTLKPEYLETLSDGKHTVTIVSDAGTASAQFYVALEEPEETIAPTEPPVQEPNDKPGNTLIPYDVMLIITIVSMLIAAGCLICILVVALKNSKNGRFGKYHEK